jgi:Periplasmic serine proteases (ClpP class)
MSNYIHVLDRLVNTPLLITSEKLDVITSAVSLRLLADAKLDSYEVTPQNAVREAPIPQIAVIPVYGSLVNKNGAGASGMTSYQRIKSQINSALSDGIKHIVFDVSSPGGEAAGAFPLSDYIQSLPSKGVSTYGFTDSQAASGGYIIFASCQHTFATDIADIGSIGAVMTLVDVTEADKQDGIKYTILRSKEDKAGYNPHEKLTDKVTKQLLSKLETLDTKFNNAMVASRKNKLTMQTITDLGGQTVDATAGLSLGLVDNIVVGIEDVFTFALSTTQSYSEVLPTDVSTKPNKEVKQMSEANLAEKLVALQTEVESLRASQTLEVAKAKQEERNRCVGVITSGATFNVSSEMVTKAITKGWSLDMVADMFTELAEKADTDTAVKAGAAPVASADAAIAAELAAQQAKAALSFDEQVALGMKQLADEPTAFAGVM